MRRLLTIFGNSLLILAAVSCVYGAVVSAFSLTVDTSVLLISWAAAALALSVLASFWRIKGILILLLPILALVIWKLPEIISGAELAAFSITNEYSKWLFIPILFPDVPDAVDLTFELTLFISAAGIVTAFLLSIAICLRRSAFLTVLFTAPIVFLTFVIVFFQPDLIFILGLLAVYLTMLFSNALFPDNFCKRGTAVFPAFALALLFMGVAYILAPPDNYNREENIRIIDNQIRHFASRIGVGRVKSGFGWPVVYDDTWGFNTENVGVSEAGTRVIADISLLEVTSSEAGVFYLRGYSMQSFDKGAWTVNSDSLLPREDALARGLPVIWAISYFDVFREVEPVIVTMKIDRTGDVTRNVAYTAYYSSPNNFNTSTYSYYFLHVEENILDLYAQVPSDYSFHGLYDFRNIGSLREPYLEIEDSTAEGLRKIAADAGIDPNADHSVISDQIVDYFSSFGVYTLSPFIIPDGEDFALYFLQTSRQGYCIHYATAATLMLRALGVPARFTSGFVVSVGWDDVDQPIVLTDRNAHAWVEVFYDEVGWLPLEVTPPATGFGESDGRPNAGAGNRPPNEWDDIGPDPLYPDPDWMLDQDPHDTADQESGTGAGGAGESLLISVTGGVMLGILIVIILFSLVMRGIITRKNRDAHFSLSDTNASVIFAWRYLSRLMRLKRNEQPPKEIEELALKARFSQHCLSEDERSVVVGYALGFADKVNESRSWIGRFWIRNVRGF